MSDSRFSVLMVDDERAFVEVLGERLRARGWRVDAVSCGEAAVAAVDEAEYDAVLLDLEMPGLDGLETLRRIRQLDPAQQVIIVSGHATLARGAEAVDLGAMDVLEKPVPIAVLAEKIQEAARRRQRLLQAHPQRRRRRPGEEQRPPLARRLLPFLGWIGECRGSALRADLLGGLTVALVLIPQSMAYAQLAGLPAYYGLYAAFLPPVIASLFGSSRQLATGPVAVVSLMTAAALEPIATAGSQEYIAYAVLLALLVGAVQLLLGVLKLGLVVNFLSHPVVNGFTNAAALIIATSQLSKIFGVQVESAEHHYQTVVRVIQEALRSTHWPTLAMAALAFAIMVTVKRVNPRLPGVLMAVAATTVLAWAFQLEHRASAPIDRFVDAEARAAILDFNRTVAERRSLEGFRTAMNKEQDRVFDPEHQVCSGCHDRRAIARFTAAPAGPSPEILSGRALLLHHQAHLLDARIAELKQEEGGLRTRLRQLRFVVDEPDAAAPAVALAHGDDGGSGRWRLVVGNGELDHAAVPLRAGGAVVGAIPSGLPAPSLPSLNPTVVLRLLPVALIISLLGFMEAISIAKAMAAKRGDRLDPNQELVGQGLANAVGSLFQSYAVSGSFSRSAVNFQAGATTGLSNAFSSVVVVVTLLFLTPLLYHLPQAVLAAIIMMAVFGLLNIGGFVHAWRAQPFDGVTSIATFAATLYFAPHLEWGIALGVVLSLGAYLFRTMHPHVAQLSLHEDGSLRDARRHGLRRCRHIAAIRFDGPLNFASCSYLETEILARIGDMPSLRHVLIVAHGINEIDASGEEMLEKILHYLRASGCRVSFSGLKDNVVDVLQRTHLFDEIGEENTYPTQLVALRAIFHAAHEGGEEFDCPLRPRDLPPAPDVAPQPPLGVGSVRSA